MSNNEESRYEMMVIFSPDLTENETQSSLKKLITFIESNGGSISHQDIWGKRELAYTIKKQTEGYYVVLYFSGEEINLSEIDLHIRLDKEVLRHLTTKLHPKDTIVDYAEILRDIPSRPISVKQLQRDEEQEEKESAKKPLVSPEKSSSETPTKKSVKENDESLDKKLDSLLDDDLQL